MKWLVRVGCWACLAAVAWGPGAAWSAPAPPRPVPSRPVPDAVQKAINQLRDPNPQTREAGAPGP